MKINEIIKEMATAGATSAANVAVGVVYPNKRTKKSTVNALDSSAPLITGGSSRVIKPTKR